VIYISGILIHEKYLVIDFARKEIVGVACSDSVRTVRMSAVQPAARGKTVEAAVLADLNHQRQQHDARLKTGKNSADFVAQLVADQAELLTQLEWDKLQGYDFSRPVSGDVLSEQFASEQVMHESR